MEKFKVEDSDDDHELVRVIGLDADSALARSRPMSRTVGTGPGLKQRNQETVKAVIMNNKVMSAAQGVTGQGVVSLYNNGLFPARTAASKGKKQNYLYKHVQNRTRLYDTQPNEME